MIFKGHQIFSLLQRMWTPLHTRVSSRFHSHLSTHQRVGESNSRIGMTPRTLVLLWPCSLLVCAHFPNMNHGRVVWLPKPTTHNLLPWDSQWSIGPFDYPEKAGVFFCVKEVLCVHIGAVVRRCNDGPADRSSIPTEELEKWRMMNPLSDYSDYEEMDSKFIIPQVLDLKLRSAPSGIDFDFAKFFIVRAWHGRSTRRSTRSQWKCDNDK